MSSEQAITKAPHPMPGFVCVIPIPGANEPAPSDRRTELLQLMLGPSAHVLDLNEQSGMQGALVIGVTEIDGHEHLTPYAPGHKIYYREDAGITIGEYVFVRVDRVVAWEEE